MIEVLLSLFIRYGIPILLKKEVLTAIEAEAVELWYVARKLKTYEEYPTGKNGGSSSVKPVAKGQSNANFNQG